jgi:hypothetical protein
MKLPRDASGDDLVRALRVLGYAADGFGIALGPKEAESKVRRARGWGSLWRPSPDFFDERPLAPQAKIAFDVFER